MIEEMLIALACPIMTVQRLKGGQIGFSGHVINMPQDIFEFARNLPRPVADLPILIVKRRDEDNCLRSCKVRRQHVCEALIWLQQNNPFYRDITIDMGNLQSLPDNGVPDGLQYFDEENIAYIGASSFNLAAYKLFKARWSIHSGKDADGDVTDGRITEEPMNAEQGQ